MNLARTFAPQLRVAVRVLLVATVALGIGYPLLVTGLGRVAFADQAAGSPVTADGRTVGSALIGQSFTDDAGDPLPQYFQSRPSAGGNDAMASGGSNLGPNNPELVTTIEERRAAAAAADGVDPAAVPADALTASGSGLDPDISPAYARLQVPRIARERGLAEQVVSDLVEATIAGRQLGYLGESAANVLELNVALDELDPSGTAGREG